MGASVGVTFLFAKMWADAVHSCEYMDQGFVHLGTV